MAVHTEIAVHTETTVCRDGLLHGDMTVDTPLTVYTQVTRDMAINTQRWASKICLYELKKHCQLIPLQTVVLLGFARFSMLLCGSVRFCAVSAWPTHARFV